MSPRWIDPTLEPPQAVTTPELARQHRRSRFEQMLKRDPSEQGEREGDRGDEDSAPDAPVPAPVWPDRAHRVPVRPDVITTLQESLATSRFDRPVNSVLDELFDEIARGLQASRRFPGDRWRFIIRLREELLERTELEMSCQGGQFGVALRTSSEDSYRLLVQAMPELRMALARLQLNADLARLFLVTRADLP